VYAKTKYLLLKLIDEKKDHYERAIYSLNVSRNESYKSLIKRHQKKIAELEDARRDLIGPKGIELAE
jgi:Mg2+ and Co2+ transporter CorA